jgi:hypothetical protein
LSVLPGNAISQIFRPLIDSFFSSQLLSNMLVLRSGIKKCHRDIIIIGLSAVGKAKMREWIQMNRERFTDYLADKDIFKASFKFVSSLSETKKRR